MSGSRFCAAIDLRLSAALGRLFAWPAMVDLLDGPKALLKPRHYKIKKGA
jgi:hypothetical protein